MSEDTVIVQRGTASLGANSDTYILAPALVDAGATITISDRGANQVQLIGGLEITASRLASNALELTLSNGAVVTVLAADEYTFVTGGNPLIGEGGIERSFSSFAQEVLGTTLPPAGRVVSGGSATIVADGTSTGGGGSVNVITGDAGNNVLNGTTGTDEINAGAGNDTIDARAGNDTVNGEAGDDFIEGGTGNDSIAGGIGNDTIRGQDGDDSIDGGAGNDAITGGFGADKLTGGGGQDVFIYDSEAVSNTANGIDSITDFTSGEDMIDARGLVGAETILRERAASTIAIGETIQADGVTIASSSLETQVIFDTNGNGVFDTTDLVVTLDGNLLDVLTSADFNLSDGTVQNAPPVAGNDSFEITSDGAAVLEVLLNDSDPDGDPITITSVFGATLGTVSNPGDGTVVFTPNGQSGTGSFSYTIADGRGGTDTATVSLSIRGVINADPSVPTVAQDGPDTIVVDLRESSGANFVIQGFDPAEDTLVFRGLPAASGDTLAEIDGDTGIGGNPIVVQTNPFEQSILVNLGQTSVDSLVTLSLEGLSDASLVDIDLL
jgi:hypothetical protein